MGITVDDKLRPETLSERGDVAVREAVPATCRDFEKHVVDNGTADLVFGDLSRVADHIDITRIDCGGVRPGLNGFDRCLSVKNDNLGPGIAGGLRRFGDPAGRDMGEFYADDHRDIPVALDDLALAFELGNHVLDVANSDVIGHPDCAISVYVSASSLLNGRENAIAPERVSMKIENQRETSFHAVSSPIRAGN